MDQIKNSDLRLEGQSDTQSPLPSPKRMRILLTLGSWNPTHGGPFFSVGNLAKALSLAGHDVHLLAGDYSHMPAEKAAEGVRLHLLKGKLIPGIRQTRFSNVRARLDEIISEVRPDIIHDNGLWLTLNHEVALAAVRHSVPRVLSPRGTLDPWAMQYRNWKKRIALALYQRRDLESVNCFHAASPLEANNIKAFGLTQSVAVIPNGVDIPKKTAYFSESGVRIALFMGRIHPIKNLPTLLRAWACVKPSGWRLRLVGSNEVGHKEELEQLARVLGIEDTLEILDPVYKEEKESIIRDAQLLILVSKSENFGLTVVEALAFGVPAITSTETPWRVLNEEKCGWCVPGNVEELTKAIDTATSLCAEALMGMGQCGRKYVEKRFDWGVISGNFIEIYRAILA